MTTIAARIMTSADPGGGALGGVIAAMAREAGGLTAVAVTLIGVRLCWQSARYRMSMEERAKDGVLTEDEARRKIRFMAWFGPAVAFAGCALLVLGMWR